MKTGRINRFVDLVRIGNRKAEVTNTLLQKGFSWMKHSVCVLPGQHCRVKNSQAKVTGTKLTMGCSFLHFRHGKSMKAMLFQSHCLSGRVTRHK